MSVLAKERLVRPPTVPQRKHRLQVRMCRVGQEIIKPICRTHCRSTCAARARKGRARARAVGVAAAAPFLPCTPACVLSGDCGLSVRVRRGVPTTLVQSPCAVSYTVSSRSSFYTNVIWTRVTVTSEPLIHIEHDCQRCMLGVWTRTAQRTCACGHLTLPVGQAFSPQHLGRRWLRDRGHGSGAK